MTAEEAAIAAAKAASAAAAVEAIKASLPTHLGKIFPLSGTLKVVDVGANPIDGASPYGRLMDTDRTKVVGFEPNPDALALLNEKKGPNETYLPYAIADGGRHTLHICVMPGMTSLLEPNPAVLSLFFGFERWSRVVRTEEIDTMRLDDVPETAGVDLLKIDIQGAELLALQNAQERLKSALIVHTEVEFLQMYKGQPLFSEVETFMRSQGYVLHKFEPLVTRDIMPLLTSSDAYHGHSQVLWADAVFVRDFTRLDRFATDELLRLAEIVYDCYRSYDFTLYLLREHDRRTGGNYGARYFDVVRPLLNRSYNGISP